MFARLAVLGCGVIVIALTVASLEASASGSPACAGTTGANISGSNVSGSNVSGSNFTGSNISGSNVAAPGTPCWVDSDPYPFGADGSPVDPTTLQCRPLVASGTGYTGDVASCYLKVDSLAFRAWNRGLAATSPVSVSANAGASTAFGVWVFNGTRWFPDATFPGQSVCKGTTVLWAGKRDYWLVGARVKNWPRLCRFDGVNFEWQPLDVPAAATAHVPLDGNGRLQPGAINAGSCFSWDNCWFFGTYGVVLHWDGNVLSDASPDLATYTWLRGEYTAALARKDSAGNPFGVAVATTGGVRKGTQLPPQPDSSAPPQVYTSSGGAFSPLGFAPPSSPQPGDPYRTDLVAVDFDAQGNGWVAGDPVGYRAEQTSTPFSNPSADERRVSTTEPAPLVRVSSAGTVTSCPAAPPGTFTYADAPGSDGFLWSSISAFPGTGDALAGGQLRPASPGANLNDDARAEPLIVGVWCSGVPEGVRFRARDPFAANAATADLLPADRTGSVSAVAANAANDGWAATTQGVLQSPSDPNMLVLQRPHLYRLTDTMPPLAAAGDDNEPRPLVFAPDPPIFIEAPPDPEPPEPPPTTVTQSAPAAVKSVKLAPAIYNVKAKVLAGKRGGLYMYVTFKVRRPVTIGVQALRREKVVASSGLKHFRGTKGTLVMKLDRKRWPTRIRFVTPKGATS